MILLRKEKLEGQKWTGNRPREFAAGHGTALHLDYRGKYAIICICQDLQNSTPKKGELYCM